MSDPEALSPIADLASPEPTSFQVQPIASIRSCYPQRFGIPRQAGLVPSAIAEIIFAPTDANRLALRGIDAFSHLWIVFWLHGQNYAHFKPLVQPPILGGKKTMGVYATRSPNRPNPLGLSVVRLESVKFRADELCLRVSGGDFLDATPVIDIKPYLPYVDAIATANNAWAEPQAPLPIQWCEAAVNTLWQSNCPEPEPMQQLITETLAQDPRPAHERGKDGHPGQQWNLQVANFSVFWIVEGGVAIVTELAVSG